MVHETNERQVDSLASGSLDNRGLAHSSSVKIDVGSFLSGFGLDVQVQQLDDISDKVR